VSLPLIIFGLIRYRESLISSPFSIMDALFILLQLMIASLVEYMTHRYPLHRKMPGGAHAYRQHTLRHHQYFTDVNIEATVSKDYYMILFPVWGVALLQYGLNLPLSLAMSFLLGVKYGALGLILGPLFFFAYETIHAICHFPKDSRIFRIPGLSFLREHHRIHHHKGMMSNWNFNIVFPLWDRIFGTLKTRIY
jgi:sterol desaturase/sphingolipid hydroxylase (fatty acid hydroxylase superfamily)